jgi:hypothetical protein
MGTNAPFVFLAGAAVLALWALIPVHAHRTAARRRAALDLTPGSSSGLDLLWLAPIAVALSTIFWSSAGRAGDPGIVMADYVEDWRTGRAEAAGALFETPPASPAAIVDAWAAQLANLRNDLVRLAAVSGPGSGIDPADPLASVQWNVSEGDESGVVVADIEVVRRETVRGVLFGLLPSTSQRLVTLERLGTIELRVADLPGQLGGQGWRIVRVEVGGIIVGS